jgi:hypothetical protein
MTNAMTVNLNDARVNMVPPFVKLKRNGVEKKPTDCLHRNDAFTLLSKYCPALRHQWWRSKKKLARII